MRTDHYYINNFFACYSSEGQLNIVSDYVNHKNTRIIEFKKGVGIDHCNKK